MNVENEVFGLADPARFPALAPVRITAPCTVTLQPVFPKRGVEYCLSK